MRSEEQAKLAKEHLRIYSQLTRELVALGCDVTFANKSAGDLRDLYVALRQEKRKLERERPPNQEQAILGKIKRIEKRIAELLELPSRKNLPIVGTGEAG